MPRPRFLRFGLLAVFAAMLILISGAGWFRSELDLYREEQAIVAEVAKAGCRTHAFRGPLDATILEGRQKEGGAWYEPDWLRRMTSLSIIGDPPESLLRRAAALPTLQSLSVSPIDPSQPVSVAPLPALPTFPPYYEMIGRTLPQFREPSIDAGAPFSEPPDGEEIEGAERAAVLESMRAIWRRDTNELPAHDAKTVAGLPARFIKRIHAAGSHSLPGFDPMEMKIDLIRDGEFYWSMQRVLPDHPENRMLTLKNDEGEYGLTYDGKAWRFCQRADADIHPLWAQQTAHTYSHNELPRPYLWRDFPHATILDHVARISRIDGRRLRLDVEPFEVDVTKIPAFPASFDVEEMTLVLREDMDWAVGSERSRVTIVSGTTRSSPNIYVVERTFERRDGYVLPIEEVRGWQSPSAGERVDYPTARTRYAWELNPDLDPAVFDPNRYLAEPLPPRTRPFPWWFVTLALGVGTVAFLFARVMVRLVRRRGRFRKPEPAASRG
ncbi:MAG TPA: hypothetical protein VGN57_16105 [Pirellulaceae bacterium]|jgi:hypothetical protein|nr:hypothetical protein [Pirellulaceae bacterium]